MEPLNILKSKLISDCSSFQVIELDEILSRNIAVLQSDGKFRIESSVPEESPESHTEGVIQISDDEEGGNADSLKCKKCKFFIIQKTKIILVIWPLLHLRTLEVSKL